MDRREMNALVLQRATRDPLRDEITHLLLVWGEDGDHHQRGYDAVCALLDAEQRFEAWLSDGMEDPVQRREIRRGISQARRVLVEIGFYRVMTEDEISSTWVSGGRSPWDFRLDGVPYTSDETTHEWMERAAP